jgi:hypothetical protein
MQCSFVIIYLLTELHCTATPGSKQHRHGTKKPWEDSSGSLLIIWCVTHTTGIEN